MGTDLLRQKWEKEAHADPARGTNPDGIGFSATGIEAEVCQDIAKRQAMGLKKYGTTVADNPLTKKQWIQHAYEEALDLAVYLKRLSKFK